MEDTHSNFKDAHIRFTQFQFAIEVQTIDNRVFVNGNAHVHAYAQASTV